jgi:DNA-binding NarL/FixJ family response regulator
MRCNRTIVLETPRAFAVARTETAPALPASIEPVTSVVLDHAENPAPRGPGETITVAIIDDNRLLRDALTAMLNQLGDVRVVASPVADPTFLARTKPQVLLLDVGLHDQDSLRLAAAFTRDIPDAKIIVMDLVAVNEEIMEFVNAGVSGFILKDATFDEFVTTIRAVAAGEKVLPPRMTESLFSQIAKAADGRAREEMLEDVRMTRREREVIELIGEGLSNKEIAQRLNIAAHTVKSHVRNVMEKLALHTRLQIAAYSRRDEAGS